jgi:glycine/serine hydroxymethyltransferase
MKTGEMQQIAALIDRALASAEDEGVLAAVHSDVKALAAKFPLYRPS